MKKKPKDPTLRRIWDSMVRRGLAVEVLADWDKLGENSLQNPIRPDFEAAKVLLWVLAQVQDKGLVSIENAVLDGVRFNWERNKKGVLYAIEHMVNDLFGIPTPPFGWEEEVEKEEENGGAE